MFKQLFGTSTETPTNSDTAQRISIFAVVTVLTLLSGLWIGTVTPVHFSEVSGNSMEPTLSEGDLLIAFETSSIGTGDIVIVQDETCFENEYVVHRVVEVTENGYMTQGDNNPITDQEDAGCEALSQSAITGKVVFGI